MVILWVSLSDEEMVMLMEHMREIQLELGKGQKLEGKKEKLWEMLFPD